MKILLLSFLFLFSTGSFLFADSASILEKAVKALDNPRLCRTAEARIKRLMSDKDKVIQVKARVALAGFFRQKGKPEPALRFVKPYAELKISNLTEPQIKGFIEAALCYAAVNKTVSAYKLLDYGKQHAKGIPGVLSRIALADMVEPVPDIDKALTYCKEAISYGDKWFHRALISKGTGEREPAKPGHEKWPPLKKEILARIKRLERQLRIDKWGLDYVLYVEAQQARKSSDPFATDFSSIAYLYPGVEKHRNVPSPNADYKAALEKYNLIIKEFPEGVFAEAAQLYQCVCLAKTGKISEAKKGLVSFYKDNPDGLYRGEALKLLGDLWLQDSWDIKKALPYYQSAVKWCRKVRETARTAQIYAVPSNMFKAGASA